jgi:acyl-CoA dehydrogenase
MVTAEQLEIRGMARDFALGEIRPHAPIWDAARELPGDLYPKLAEMGFMGMTIPEEHGGLGLDQTTYLLALEALAWGDAATALGVAIHNGPVTGLLMAHGTPEQKARWLPEMATGAALGVFALSEEEAGSDPAALGLRADRAGEGWSLTGEKRWVTNGARGGLLLIFARTGGEPGDKDGISAFLVPGGSSGVSVSRRERTLGLSASETVGLAFDGVDVPGDALLGREGEGYAMAMEALVPGRLGIAAQALGIGQAAYEHALEYAREREQFGRSLDAFGAIREKLAGMAIRIEGARAFLLTVAREMEEAAGDARELALPASLRARAAMAKVMASEAAMWSADEAVQIFGGYGYMRDYPVEKLMRDAKGTEIYEGANEVLRSLVAADAIREAGGSA